MLGLLCAVLYAGSWTPPGRRSNGHSIFDPQPRLGFTGSDRRSKGGWLRGTDEAVGRPPDIPIAVVTPWSSKGWPSSTGSCSKSSAFQNARALIDQALREDGAFEGGLVTNYVTSCVVSALAVIEGADDPRVQGVGGVVEGSPVGRC